MIGSIFLVLALQQQASHQVVHTVTAGETLSSIAPPMGESWQQLYAGNRSVIGPDPNLIYPGEVLHSGTARVVTVHASAPGKTWDVTYGDPNYCGDGDGDGWDVPCGKPVTPPPAHPAAVTTVSSGSYSYAGLEALWESAGGNPAHAATAACIAEHESGGNPGAVSPTADFGLWQIHDGGSSMLNAFANALRAVAMSFNGTSWSPWTTHSMCGV